MRYKEILIATSNNYKKEQFNYLFSDFSLEIKTLSDFSFNEKPKEDMDTAEDNALLKARFWSEKIKEMPVLADDAGLEIDALNGEPGIKARRWGGLFKDTVSDEEWLNYLLKRMKGIPLNKRTARFKAAWAVVFPDRTEIVQRLNLPFLILEEPVKPYPEGSPISAVRFNVEYNKMESNLSKKEQWEEQKRYMDNWSGFKRLMNL